MARPSATVRECDGFAPFPFRSAGKEKMKWLTFSLMIWVSLLLCSCKPKAISGKLFLTDGSGIVKPISAVEIFLIDAKEADDFINQKKLDVKNKTDLLNTQIIQLKKDRDLAESEYESLKATNDAYIANDFYTNDQRYADLVEESNKETRVIRKFSNAIILMRSQYGEPPQIRIKHYSQAELDAFNAQELDYGVIQEVKRKLYETKDAMYALPYKVKDEKQSENIISEKYVWSIDGQIKEANNSLDEMKKTYFYFDGFSPKPIETTITDDNGDFILNNPKKGEKIFSMIKSSDDKSGLFWLVDLPASGDKLILSNQNIFAVP
jgi:hypothetical protein